MWKVWVSLTVEAVSAPAEKNKNVFKKWTKSWSGLNECEVICAAVSIVSSYIRETQPGINRVVCVVKTYCYFNTNVFRDLWRNQIWQQFKKTNRLKFKPVPGVCTQWKHFLNRPNHIIYKTWAQFKRFGHPHHLSFKPCGQHHVHLKHLTPYTSHCYT